jgi:hypothetical protein
MRQQELDLDGYLERKKAAKAFTEQMEYLGEGNDYGRYRAWRHKAFIIRSYPDRHSSRVKYELRKGDEVLDYEYGGVDLVDMIERFIKKMEDEG